jgi:hypothetical protein
MLTFSKRKEQLGQLALACEQGERARLVQAGVGGPPRAANTKLLSLHDDGVLLYSPGVTCGLPLAGGAAYDVYFEFAGSRYWFAGESLGELAVRPPNKAAITALKLKRPLVIEERQQRNHFRVSLAAGEPIHVDAAGVEKTQLRFRARLINLSAGGMALLADWSEVRSVDEGALLTVRFALATAPAPVELVVKVAHIRRHEDRYGPRGVVGAALVPADDQRARLMNSQHLERFIRERQRAALRRGRR